MEFEYYHNNDGDQFRYIQLPTILLEHRSAKLEMRRLSKEYLMNTW